MGEAEWSSFGMRMVSGQSKRDINAEVYIKPPANKQNFISKSPKLEAFGKVVLMKSEVFEEIAFNNIGSVCTMAGKEGASRRDDGSRTYRKCRLPRK